MRSRSSTSRRLIPGAGAYWDSLVQPALGRDAHRPQTQDEMRIAIREMAARGMTDHTIAAATQLSVEQVRRLLEKDAT